jgi:addiction module HigA family antidote
MHPGELLREDVLPAVGRSKAEIARLLGVSRQTLYDILAERSPVTPSMALRLVKLCGNGPALWLNLQGHYDLRPFARSADRCSNRHKVAALLRRDRRRAANIGSSTRNAAAAASARPPMRRLGERRR